MNPAESKNTSYLSFQACRFLYLKTHQSQIGSSQLWALENRVTTNHMLKTTT